MYISLESMKRDCLITSFSRVSSFGRVLQATRSFNIKAITCLLDVIGGFSANKTLLGTARRQLHFFDRLSLTFPMLGLILNPFYLVLIQKFWISFGRLATWLYMYNKFSCKCGQHKNYKNNDNSGKQVSSGIHSGS